jgi:pimeloyl-ACP methyl ester carboxylesterase
MDAYVLVGGGWLGGWCWQRVARRLREEGLDAYPVTLTGLGERVHLASPEVNFATHITDVVNVIEFEDLDDVVLLGHSYGGLVAMGAADRFPTALTYLRSSRPKLESEPRIRCRSWARAGSSRCHRRKSWLTWPAWKG